jgi:hypothetical protein
VVIVVTFELAEVVFEFFLRDLFLGFVLVVATGCARMVGVKTIED